MAYKLARKTGQTRIIMYRINGAYATATLSYDGVDIIKFSSIAASDLYNAVKFDCGPDKMTITGSDGTARHYFFSSYPSSNLLVDAINIDAEFGILEFTASVLVDGFNMSTFNDENTVSFTLQGGDSESDLIPIRGSSQDITPIIASLKERLNQALFGDDPEDQENYNPNSDLSELQFGVICLVDMFHDDGGDFTNILGRFCLKKSTELNNGSIGVVGVSPIFDVTDQAVADKYVSLISMSPTNKPAGLAEVGVEEAKVVASHYSYVQVVIGDITNSSVFSATPEPLSMAYAYAALQAYLTVETSMTNKGFIGLSRVNYEFSKEKIDSLLANGYISIVSSIRRGVVPYQAITAVGKKANSLLKNPSVVRVSHILTKRVTEYLDEFIGGTSTAISRKNLDTGLYNVLKALVEEDKLIRNYELQVDYSLYGQEVSIKISYVPLSYVDSVTTTVDMPLNREVII
jgi:hypothetical protein